MISPKFFFLFTLTESNTILFLMYSHIRIIRILIFLFNVAYSTTNRFVSFENWISIVPIFSSKSILWILSNTRHRTDPAESFQYIHLNWQWNTDNYSLRMTFQSRLYTDYTIKVMYSLLTELITSKYSKRG